MYWKLVENVEYDYGEYPMSSQKIVAAVMARNKSEAKFWFKLLCKNGTISFTSTYNMEKYIFECSVEEYLSFIDSIA